MANVLIQGGGAAPPAPTYEVFGIPTPPPPPPTARPTLGTAPTVSSTPGPGQGIATDSAGRLPSSVAAQAVPVFTADPADPTIGQCWYRSDLSQFCVRHDATTTKRVTLA